MHRPKLKKITDGIFCLEFTNAYDLSMTFLRCQEFYESPKYRNKFFKLEDFMEWYSKEYGNGSFSYPVDYVGFNLPGRVIKNVLQELQNHKYDVWTKYDQLLWEAVQDIRLQQPLDPFYVIGIIKGDRQVLRHEVAHGLFTINADYRDHMSILLDRLPKKAWAIMKEKLKGRGYAPNVYRDEAQAYFATGLHETMRVDALREAKTEFMRVFKKYVRGILK